MKINWPNIFGLILLIFSIYLFFKMKPALSNIFEDIDAYHCYGSMADFMKIFLISMICLTIIAVASFISRK